MVAYFIALHYLAKALHRVTSTSFRYRVNGAINDRTRLGDVIFEKYSCINTNWVRIWNPNFHSLAFIYLETSFAVG